MLDTQNLHLFAESIPHIVWTATPSGMIDFCNEYGLSTLNTSQKEIKGKNWVEFVHPEEKKDARKQWDKAIQNQASYANKIRVLEGVNNTYRWFQVDANPIKNETGEVEKWVGIAIDIQNEISEAKRLASNNAKFEEILNSLPDTNIYLFDENFRYLEVRGPKFEEGPFPSEIVGKTVEEAFGKDWAEFSVPLYQKVLEGGTFYEEVATETKDYFLQGAPLNLPEEDNPRGILIVREITAQVNSLSELKKREEDIRFLLESSMHLSTLSSTKEIYDYLGKQLFKLIDEKGSVALSRVSQDETKWSLESYLATNEIIKKSESLLGKKIFKLNGDLSEEHKELYKSRTLVDIGLDFVNTSGGIITKTINTSLQKLLRVKHNYNIGFFHEGKLYGIATALTKQSLSQAKVELIEALVLQAPITLEKVANKENREQSEKRFTTLVSSMREGVMSLDASGIVVTANNAAQEILSLSAEEMIGIPITDLNLQVFVDEQTFRAPKTHPVLQVLQKKKAQRGIIIGIRRVPDRVTWINMNAEPIFHEKDTKEIASVVVSFTDITKLKRSEDRLALYLRQQTILSKIAQKLNTANDLEEVLEEVLDLIGSYTHVSRVSIFEDYNDGLDCRCSQEWIDRDIFEKKRLNTSLNYKEVYPWRETLTEDRIIASKSINTVSGKILNFLEKRKVQSLVALPIFLSDHYFGFIIFEDCRQNRGWRKSELDFLTLFSEMIANAFERKKLQQGLIESEERLLRANQLAKLGHWEWDPYQDEVIWSKEIYEFFQHDPKKPAIPFSQQGSLYTEESKQELIKVVEQSSKTGRPYTLELQADPNAFGIKYFHVMGIPEMKNGELHRLFGSMQDITESRLSALQIENQNESLKKLNNELDLIMKILSHDLKSPIHQAKGLMRLLEIDPSNADIMGHMNKSIRKLQTITDDLLNLAINNRSKVEPEEMSWKEFIDLCVEEHEGQEGFQEIEWNVTIKGKDSFSTDTKRLKVILRNLFSNAIKYRNPSTDIKSFIQIDINCKKNKASIKVADNGLGIEKDKLDLIFEMFYQVDEAKKGVGLGLHIVRQMLQKIKGEVEVSSEESQGTTFKVQLPYLKNTKK